MTELEFAKCTAMLQTGFGKEILPPSKTAPTKAEVWYECLKDLSFASMMVAVKRWLCERNRGFEPTIAELRELAVEAAHGRMETAAEAYEEFTRVRGAISPFYEPARFIANLSGHLKRTMDAVGGLHRLQELMADDMATYSAQWRKAYEDLSRVESIDRRLPEDCRPRLSCDRRADGPARLGEVIPIRRIS